MMRIRLLLCCIFIYIFVLYVYHVVCKYVRVFLFFLHWMINSHIIQNDSILYSLFFKYILVKCFNNLLIILFPLVFMFGLERKVKRFFLLATIGSDEGDDE